MAFTMFCLRPTSVSAKGFLNLQHLRNTSTLPHTIKPSQHEIPTGRLGPRNLEVATSRLHEDGLVVISDIIPHEDLDH